MTLLSGDHVMSRTWIAGGVGRRHQQRPAPILRRHEPQGIGFADHELRPIRRKCETALLICGDVARVCAVAIRYKKSLQRRLRVHSRSNTRATAHLQQTTALRPAQSRGRRCRRAFIR